ncbi:transposase [Janthinobacterium sp. PC23-8]|uniref:IS66-like element accessory protein TnpA n=1 Tax=Janthinobacterium sp. PC23-8 TaxID=2012679 RepID=UPI001595BCB7|nr:transposase [Janthinobacterium sp. PC23-8]
MDTVLKRGSRSGRLNYPRSFKLKVALEACTPSISVSQLALQHQLNANMVFKWRREYLAGLFAGFDTEESALLPVVLVTEQEEPPAVLPAPAPPCQRGSIAIELGGAVVRIEGTVDADTLRLVIASLRA